MPEGGVQAEWTIGQVDILLKIDIEKRLGHWQVIGAGNDEEVVLLHLDTQGGWNWIVAEIAKE